MKWLNEIDDSKTILIFMFAVLSLIMISGTSIEIAKIFAK